MEISGSLRNSFRASLKIKNLVGRALFGLGAHPGLPHSDKLRMPMKKCLDDLWVAEKFQTNLEIAGSLLNSFRASVDVKSLGGRALFD